MSAVKEISFEDTALQFKNTGGKWRVSLRQIADYYGISFKHASGKLTSNLELFRDLGTGRVTGPVKGIVIDYELSIRDAVSFLTLLNYKRYDDDRKHKLIRMRNWLADNAEKILVGESSYVPTRESVDRLGGEYTEHSFLNRLCIEVTRKERTRNPHSGIMSEKEMFKEDFDDVCGPVEFVPRWRNKLDKLNGKKLAAKKVFVIHEMLSKNTDRAALRRSVIKTFEDICPDLMPDYMPRSIQIDATKQMLLV